MYANKSMEAKTNRSIKVDATRAEVISIESTGLAYKLKNFE